MQNLGGVSNPNESPEVTAGLARARAATIELAAQGWTTPLWLLPRQSWQLLGSGNATEVDANFMRLYAPEGEAYVRLVAALRGRPALDRWQPLLAQVVTAYERGEHAITVPALLTVLEGLIMGVSNRRTDVTKATDSWVKQEDPSQVVGWLWESLARFIEEVFKYSDFSADRPVLINRHWILHGRDVADWSMADSLRLMQAVEVLASMRQLHQTPSEVE